MLSFRKAHSRILATFLTLIYCAVSGTCFQVAFAAGREVAVPDFQFQPIRPTQAITLREAVNIAIRNYPSIAQRQYKLRAALANVTLAKTQYLPNLNWDVQESGVTGNRIASVVMNNVSGFDTVPVDSGPSVSSQSLKPIMNNLEGLNFNWLVVDGGLRHANDDFARADARAARADLKLTLLDVAFGAADAFLTAVAAKQLIRSAQAALDRMQAADLLSRTLVSKGLKPGADAAAWDFDVARAKIKVIKADKEIKLALVDLAEQMGIANTDVDVVCDPVVRSPIEVQPFGPFDLTSHPLALFKTAEVERWKQKVRVLDVAYRPHVWINSSLWGRGSGAQTSINPVHSVAGGVLPQVFNYMIGASLSFPILEYFPLQAERKMALNNELAAKADFDLAMQILEKKDAKARILLAEARRVAEETPLLVQAAKVKEIKTLKRYRVGLANMVVVAEAERELADAEVEDALAQIEVWRSILALAYVQGELKPFLQLVAIAEGNREPPPSPLSNERR
jgi:outer membrane protein TolC